MKDGKDLNYLEINRKSWNSRTSIHFESEFYDNQSFISGRNSLNHIELDLLGDVKGKSILHLQCHFGQDSISLARMGAEVTGVDLSDISIEKARELNKIAKTDCEFVCCDVYDSEKYIDKKFDIVFTSYGTIGWLPDIDKWAGIIAHFLKDGGKLIFADFHPVVWMFDDSFSKIKYRYFNSGPIVESQSGTYTDKDADIEINYVGWNHSMSEVINNLISHGLRIDVLNEFDYSPYNCFSNTEKVGDGAYRIKSLNDKIPMVYAIEATKK